MATVKVETADLMEGTCPAVCVRCGATATCTVGVTVSHTETGATGAWVLGLLIGTLGRLLAAHIASTSAVIHLPVCPDHASRGGLYTPAGQRRLVFGMLGFGVVFLTAVLLGHEYLPELPVAPVGLLVFLVVVPVGLVALSRYKRRMIDAVDMAEKHMVLVNVSPEFARAVEEQRQADRLAREARLQRPGEPPAIQPPGARPPRPPHTGGGVAPGGGLGRGPAQSGESG